jgi:hypothetical protein
MTPARTIRPAGLKVDGGIFTDLADVPELAVELEQRRANGTRWRR